MQQNIKEEILFANNRLNYIGTLFVGDLYIGNKIVLYSRTLQILDYGDDFTRNNCSTSSESTFAMVKPGGIQQIGNILSNIQNSGFTLARAKMIQMGRHQAEHFCRKYQTAPTFNDLGKNVKDDFHI